MLTGQVLQIITLKNVASCVISSEWHCIKDTALSYEPFLILSGSQFPSSLIVLLWLLYFWGTTSLPNTSYLYYVGVCCVSFSLEEEINVLFLNSFSLEERLSVFLLAVRKWTRLLQTGHDSTKANLLMQWQAIPGNILPIFYKAN